MDWDKPSIFSAGRPRRGRLPMRARRSASANRAQLRRVLAELGKGDVLMVTRLDRLAAQNNLVYYQTALRLRPGRGRRPGVMIESQKFTAP